MCVCGLTGLGKSEVVPSSCNLFNFFSSFPVFNKSHGDFFVFKVSFFDVLLLFEVITWSLRLWAAHSGSSRGLWHFSTGETFYYVLAGFTLCGTYDIIGFHKDDEGSERFVLGKTNTHTQTHRGGSKCSYLVISDVLVLSCFYLLPLLFFNLYLLFSDLRKALSDKPVW